MSDALPKPLTPADCDCRGLPFMPLDLVRLFDSDIYSLSSGDEFKAAFTLWGKAFLQVPAGSLPNDERILARLSGAGAKWKRVRNMALKGFVLCSDNRFYHPVVCEKALEAWRHRQSQRARATKRWQSDGTAAAHPTAHPTAMQGTVKGQGQSRSNGESTHEIKTAEALVIRTRLVEIFQADEMVAMRWQWTTIATWLAQGIAAQEIFLAAERTKAKGITPRTLDYLTPVIADARGKKPRAEQKTDTELMAERIIARSKA